MKRILFLSTALLFLFGCIAYSRYPCPDNYTLAICPYCRELICLKPDLSQMTCYNCESTFDPQVAIRLYDNQKLTQGAEKQKWYGGICNNCGGRFSFNPGKVNDSGIYRCPFCGEPQDLSAANDKYNFAKTQMLKMRAQYNRMKKRQKRLNNY